MVVIGCPQASIEEIRRMASAVRSYAEMGAKIPDNRLWLFTSGENYQLAADVKYHLLEDAGVVICKTLALRLPRIIASITTIC